MRSSRTLLIGAAAVLASSLGPATGSARAQSLLDPDAANVWMFVDGRVVSWRVGDGSPTVLAGPDSSGAMVIESQSGSAQALAGVGEGAAILVERATGSWPRPGPRLGPTSVAGVGAPTVSDPNVAPTPSAAIA